MSPPLPEYFGHPKAPPRGPTHDVEEALVGIDGVQQLVDMVLGGDEERCHRCVPPPAQKANAAPPPRPQTHPKLQDVHEGVVKGPQDAHDVPFVLVHRAQMLLRGTTGG